MVYQTRISAFFVSTFVILMMVGCVEAELPFEGDYIWQQKATFDAVKARKNSAVDFTGVEGGLEIASKFDRRPGPSGKTGGAYFSISPSVERTVSGRKVRISLLVRPSGPIDKTQRFAFAYSTNSVGNSNWRWFPLHPGDNIYQFDYDVPRDSSLTGGQSNGDFLGVLSDVHGKGRKIIVRAAAIELMN